MKIVAAILYVCNMTLNDDVVSTIEKNCLPALLPTCTLKPLQKRFLLFTGLRSWKQDDIFAREPIRRLALCSIANEVFLSNNRQNPFHFQKFDLEQIYIYRKGMSIAESPISTNADKSLYFNAISELAYVNHGHGISLPDYPNNFIMVFDDLTSTQQASHDFIHPEVITCSISIELRFSAALPNNFEIFMIGKKSSTIFVGSSRWVSKITF